MANDASTNPISINTAGDVTNDKQIITGYLVIASDDTWKCELYNTGAAIYKKIFRAESEVSNDRTFGFSPAKPHPVAGIYAATMTDIAEVLVYIDAAAT